MNTSFLIKENVSLAALTTLKVGGAARYFVKAETEQAVVDAVDFAEENNFPLFVLGGGSNLLVSDEGFDGLVLQIALQGVEFDEATVTAQAGEDWDDFVALAVAKNLAGIECLSGIPGFVGGTPVQNVGAYGQEVSETITKVRVFDRRSRQILELSNADCRFSYRASLFNTTEKNRFIVLSVTYALRNDGAPKIEYKDLREAFGAAERPTLHEVRRKVLEIRRAKSMVIDKYDINSQSAGSFFKNPIVSQSRLAEISAKTGIENIPNFRVNAGSVKIPAAWLIENSGFYKGYRKGNAGLSTNHALAIVNFGNARAKEIVALKDEIQHKVQAKFGVALVPEPVFVGFE